MVRATVLQVGENAVEGVPNTKAKVEKMALEPPMNSAQRRKLGDITNLQNQNKLMNQGANQRQQSMLYSSTEYVEKLQKENMKLTKVLMERNEIIKRSGSELQKLRINLQKVQEQNLQLAQTNTRILAGVNTSKDQLKALQHELSCKNGLLMARKLQLEAQNLRCTRCHPSEDKDRANAPGEACKSFHPTGDDQKTGKRKQQSSINSSGSSNINSLQITVKANNKRVSLRRQSRRFTLQELDVTENLSGIHDDKEVAANAGCSASDQSIGSKPEAVEPHDTKEITGKSRVSSRRQSTKQSADPPLHDDIVEESSQISSSVSMELKRESKNKTRGSEAEEMRNTSVGRPVRQAAVKIKSYKEVSLKEKMRRDF